MRFKILIFVSCALVFTVHFSMTLLHNIPEKYISPRMESYSHLWCYPLFHQGWSLFAPEPQDMTKHLDMRFASGGQWSKWHRSNHICMAEHIRYRVTHYSKLCHVTQNAAYYLWLELGKFEQQDQPAENYFPSASGYGIATHYAKSYAHHYLDAPECDSLEIRLILQDPFEELPEVDYPFPVYVIQ